MGNSNEKAPQTTKHYGDGNSFDGHEVKKVEATFTELSTASPEYINLA